MTCTAYGHIWIPPLELLPAVVEALVEDAAVEFGGYVFGSRVYKLAWNCVVLYWQEAIELSVVIDADGTTVLLIGTENMYRSFMVFASTNVSEALKKLIANGLFDDEMK